MMNRKQFFTMIIVMASMLVFLLYSFGWFSYEKYEDFTMSESENWRLAASTEEFLDPYFVFKGNGREVNAVNIQGVEYYNGADMNKEIVTEDIISKKLEMTNLVMSGVPLGENIWNLADPGRAELYAPLQGIFFKITWETKSGSFSEYIFSENLSTEKVNQIKEAIQ